MSAIRAKDTKAEIALRRALWALGLKHRAHTKHLSGRPDVVFASARLAVFCDGDFWHGRKWRARKLPTFKVRAAYWKRKIASNIVRDKRNNAELRKLGWSVMRLWETDILRNPERAADKVRRRLSAIRRMNALA